MKRLALIAVLGWSAIAAQATVIDFDTVPVYGMIGEGLISNGYMGFNWANFYALDPSIYRNIHEPTNGYRLLTGLGDPQVGYNGWAQPASFAKQSGTFSLLSMQLASAWDPTLAVEIQGWAGGSLIHQSTVSVTNLVASTVGFAGWDGIDEVRMASLNLGQQFAVDDIVIRETGVPAVPEPFTMGLAALGLGAALKRRRK